MRDSTFEASVLLYAQDPGDFFRYLGAYQSSDWMPEKALWLAVLEQAYQCVRPRTRMVGFLPQSRRAREAVNERADAEAWIQSEADYMGSFCFVCDVLELDAGWTRQLIMSSRDAARSLSDLEIQASPDLSHGHEVVLST